MAKRRFQMQLNGIIADLGGRENVSPGQYQLARRCALISVQCEFLEQIAVAGRAFERIGLTRMPRDVTPSLQDYLDAARRTVTEDADADT